MQKNYNVVIMRVTAMIMVVIYHCLCYYTCNWTYHGEHHLAYDSASLFLNSVDMDIFVFISGFLYSFFMFKKNRYHNDMNFVKKKSLRLLVPYLFWGVIIACFFTDYTSARQLPYGISHLWFLLMLFGIFAVTTLTHRLWKNLSLKQSICLWVALILLNKIYLMSRAHGISLELFCIDRVLWFLPVFYMGIIAAKFDIIRWLRKTPFAKYMYLPLLIIIAMLCIGTVRNIRLASSIASVSLYFMSMLLIPFIYIRVSYINIKPGFITSILDKVDSNTMGIYIIHHLILYYALEQEPIRLFMDVNFITAPILMFVCVMTISLLLSDMIRRSKIKFIMG